MGVEERKIKVLVEPLEELNLISGFDVDVEFLLYENENALTVPKESVFNYNDGYAVYKVIDNEINIVEVEKGTELRNDIVIENGVSSGDVIVIDSNNDDIQNFIK